MRCQTFPGPAWRRRSSAAASSCEARSRALSSRAGSSKRPATSVASPPSRVTYRSEADPSEPGAPRSRYSRPRGGGPTYLRHFAHGDWGGRFVEAVSSAPVPDALGQLAGRGLALDQILQCAELEAARDQLGLTIVADDHHRDVPGSPCGANPLQECKPVHPGQPDVKEDQVGQLFREHAQRLLAVACNMNGVPVPLELDAVHLGQRRIVFHQQDTDVVIFSLVHRLPPAPRSPALSWTTTLSH